jgi:hypothetical protein
MWRIPVFALLFCAFVGLDFWMGPLVGPLDLYYEIALFGLVCLYVLFLKKLPWALIIIASLAAAIQPFPTYATYDFKIHRLSLGDGFPTYEAFRFALAVVLLTLMRWILQPRPK